MDSYAKHLLQIAAMIGAAMLSTALLKGAPGASEGETAPQEETAALEAAPAAYAETQAEVPARTYYVSAVTEPGETVTLTDQGGTALQTRTADADGALRLGPVPPGCYCVRQGALGGEFILLENAAVETVSGTVWSDGELLHLTQTETVCVRLELRVDEAQRGRAVTVQLVGTDGSTFERVFFAERAGVKSLQFYGVPVGEYELWQDGHMLRTVFISGETALLAAGG